MSWPLSPVEVETEIARLSARLDKVTGEVAQRARAAAVADADYKVAYAQAFLQAEGTEKAREASAVVATQVEYRTRRTAEAVLLAAQEAGRNARAQLDALRSLAANVRAAIDHASGAGG